VLKELTDLLPPEGLKILLTLFLSFLIGLEREEHHSRDAAYAFGGVRTFPLLGLLGYALALLSEGSMLPLAAGFVVVGAFMVFSYRHKLAVEAEAGITTEISGLETYVLGAVVAHELYWIAATLVVVSLLLLELKEGLEGLARKLPAEEIVTFTKFLLLTAVILPVVPDEEYTIFHINPFKTWVVVVAVSTVSYASYVLLVWIKARGGVVLSALLGGVYSSTATTVVLAKRAAAANRPNLYAGAILTASGVMYLRILVLVALFNGALALRLWPSFMALASVGIAGGLLWVRRQDGGPSTPDDGKAPHNPLELRAAFLFAGLFLLMLVLTRLSVQYLGSVGVYVLAAIMGVSDVDPFILGLTQASGGAAPHSVAAAAILIAAASNNVIKGFYAYAFADRKTGVAALAGLSLLALFGLVPLFFL
jgi:uncharacterized membrane protein (DUF4010 family)